ncbi:hypothetical protein UVI_02010100 [Ustilaginoidea virens]|uniref:Uncharacterized protein n=1 Tax=Ustilaginoidea virens TaxID=1159556 RepID=A0A1B5KWE4_USTVR|nr:hypothetical protein UVI_02010100 [Ustilaginoidea virens]
MHGESSGQNLRGETGGGSARVEDALARDCDFSCRFGQRMDPGGGQKGDAGDELGEEHLE